IGLDALKAHALCLMAAERTGGLVWPPIFAGYHTMKPHAGFQHTIEVPIETIMALLNAYLDQAADEGFKLVFILMGHYGHEHVKAIRMTAEDWPKIRRRGSDMKALAFSDAELRRPDSPYPAGDHAGACETSMMMFFRPDLVRLAELPSEGPVCGTEAGYGVGGEDPRIATADLGAAIAEEIVGEIVAKVNQALGK
ncbi:MAG: creatininase family protein, partial [Armatimonadetes bacterium]|nr:creatininase family protein [Armatimonadota bacterium]